MQDWQPIETAPKGQLVLVYSATFVLAHFNTYYDMWIGTARDSEDTKMLNRASTRPTHWMPLPQPPRRLPTREQTMQAFDDAVCRLNQKGFVTAPSPVPGLTLVDKPACRSELTRGEVIDLAARVL